MKIIRLIILTISTICAIALISGLIIYFADSHYGHLHSLVFFSLCVIIIGSLIDKKLIIAFLFSIFLIYYNPLYKITMLFWALDLIDIILILLLIYNCCLYTFFNVSLNSYLKEQR